MAKKSVGKIFEDEIKASIPVDFYVERYKDDTAGFYGVSNPADYRIYKYPLLFLLELKSHKGKSLPLAKIRENQIKGMLKAAKYAGICAGFLINYRDLEKTFYISVREIVAEYYEVDTRGNVKAKEGIRKSIPVEWCEDHGEIIGQELKRVRYKYNLEKFFRRYFDEKV